MTAVSRIGPFLDAGLAWPWLYPVPWCDAWKNVLTRAKGACLGLANESASQSALSASSYHPHCKVHENQRGVRSRREQSASSRQSSSVGARGLNDPGRQRCFRASYAKDPNTFKMFYQSVASLATGASPRPTARWGRSFLSPHQETTH